MNIEKLIIKNIASIANAELDFTKELSQDSIFLICGDTGAGKSTILDAICMALYCETPKTGPNINDLLSMGQYDGSVELTFSEKGVRYVSTVTLHKTSGGNLETPKAKLVNLNTGATEVDGKSDFAKLLPEILGLGYEQFVRTAMLAQGEFARFLMSSGKEKCAILEKLTNSGIYAKIAKVIGAKTSAWEGEQKALQRDMDIFGKQLIADPEELKATQEALAKAKEDKKSSDERKLLTQRQIDWKTDYDKANADQKNLREEYYALSDKMKAPENMAKTAEAELYRKSENLRNAMKAQEDAQSRLSQLEGVSLEQKRRFQAMLFDLDNTQAQEALLQNSLREAIADRDALAPRKGVLEAYGQIGQCLKTFDNDNAKLASLNQELKDLAVKVEQAAKSLKEKNKDFDDKSLALQKAKDECERLSKQISEANEQQLNADNLKLTNAQNSIANFWGKQEAYDKLRNELTLGEKSIEELNGKLLASQGVLNEKAAALRMADAQLETVKDLTSDATQALRAHLKDGEECPVCGSRQHYFRADQLFADKLAQVQKMHDEAAEAKDAAQNAVAEVKAGLNQATQDQAKKQKQIAVDAHDLEAAKRDYEAKLQAVSLDPSSDRALLEDAVKQRLAEISARLDKVAQLHKDLQKAQSAQTGAQGAYDLAATAKSIAEKAENTAKINMQNTESNKANLTTSIAESVKVITSLMQGDDAWFAKREADRLDFDKQLETDASKWKKTLEDINNINNRLEKYKDILSVCRNHESKIRKVDGFLTLVKDSRGTGNAAKLGELFVSLDADVINNAKGLQDAKLKLNEAHKNKEREMSQLGIEAPMAAKIYSINVSDVESIERTNAVWNEKLGNLSGQLKQCEARLVELNKSECKTESVSIEQLKQEMLRLVENIRKADEDILSLSNKLSDHAKAERNIADIRVKMENVSATLAKWATLNANFGTGKGTNISRIALSYVFRHMLKMANARLKQINNRYELSQSMGTASDIEKMDIEVVDKYCGGAHRPVRSLSGGEKFMTSLALALGLSSMTSSNMKIDMLFIDEGFDTLDSKRLDDVRQTLTNLQQSMGCKVGVISHVAQLEDDIKLHLRVAADPKAGPGISKVTWER